MPDETQTQPPVSLAELRRQVQMNGEMGRPLESTPEPREDPQTPHGAVERGAQIRAWKAKRRLREFVAGVRLGGDDVLAYIQALEDELAAALSRFERLRSAVVRHQRTITEAGDVTVIGPRSRARARAKHAGDSELWESLR